MSWDSSFSVNVEEVDKQHQKLMDLINQIYDAMKEGHGKDVIGPILGGLADYTVVHFKYEEDKFKEFDYENTATHIAEHQKFVAKVSDFKAKYMGGNATISVEIMTFLKDWLVNHIKGTDQKYTKCFNEHGLK